MGKVSVLNVCQNCYGMNDIKLCSIWLYAQGVLNPIMATHDPGLTTAVAIPSAVLPSVAGKQCNLIQT